MIISTAGVANAQCRPSSQERSLFDHIRNSFTLSCTDEYQTHTKANDSTATAREEQVVVCSEAMPSAGTRDSHAQG